MTDIDEFRDIGGPGRQDTPGDTAPGGARPATAWYPLPTGRHLPNCTDHRGLVAADRAVFLAEFSRH